MLKCKATTSTLGYPYAMHQKFRQKIDRLCLRTNDLPKMHIIHVDFAELAKASLHNSRTKAFLVAIDRNTRFVVGNGDAQAVISLLSQRVFENTKVVVSDHAKVFESRLLKTWASERGIELQVGSPYHVGSNGLAERLIRDIRTLISMYPNIRGDWRAALDTAVRHHNRSRRSTIGCSLHFALNAEVPYLPADKKFNVPRRVRLQEERFSTEQEQRHREKQKENYDHRHRTKVLQVATGDSILVRKGYGKQSKFEGPFEVFGGIGNSYTATLWDGRTPEIRNGPF